MKAIVYSSLEFDSWSYRKSDLALYLIVVCLNFNISENLVKRNRVGVLEFRKKLNEIELDF